MVKFAIWDTAGHESFDDLCTMCCRGADAAIIVYDITQESSFVKAMFWVDKLQRESSPNIFKALAGNKADCVSKREVTYEVICVCSCRFTSGIKSAVLLPNLILSHHKDTISCGNSSS